MPFECIKLIFLTILNIKGPGRMNYMMVSYENIIKCLNKVIIRVKLRKQLDLNKAH